MNDLETELRQRTAGVVVVGLGYAGLPMAVEIARAGFSVTGYDLDPTKVSTILDGRSPVSNVADEEIARLRATGTFTATTQSEVLGSANVAVICVPTPLTGRDPDMGFVARAGHTIGRHLRSGMLVILQSTCAPGTTSGLLRRELEGASGLRAGQDFHLVFAPERIDPGNKVFRVSNTPKLVGGTTPESTRLAAYFFETFIDSVVPVASPEIAEMAKLVENTFRFINISFVNEMALLCDRLGVNIWEVIEAAKTKPFAFMPHYPSPGIGGHCIPVVPHYLEAAARQLGVDSELIRAADRVNQTMPTIVVDKVEAALASRSMQLENARLLFVGITYKADTADLRESAALQVCAQAASRGAVVAYHDPLIAQIEIERTQINSVPLAPDVIRASDAVVLLTPHTSVDYDLIVREAGLVIDTHGGLKPRSGPNVYNVWAPQETSDPASRLAQPELRPAA